MTWTDDMILGRMTRLFVILQLKGLPSVTLEMWRTKTQDSEQTDQDGNILKRDKLSQTLMVGVPARQVYLAYEPCVWSVWNQIE